MKKVILLIIILIVFFSLNNDIVGEEINVKAKKTLNVVEMNKGDQLHFELNNGRIVDIKLIDFKTEIIFTTLDTLKKGDHGDGTIYSMSCQIEIDGQSMELVKYVPVQKSFYEPYVINGLRIWFDALANLSNYFNENHGECLPTKDARFAFQDATLPISPKKLSNWCPLPQNNLDIDDAYRGDDTWLGTYFGSDLHGGLDINMPSNTPLWAPIDFDEHYYFNSLKAGHNNNRWRGVKYWDNGDIWYLRTHHMVELLVPPFESIPQGKKYGYAAGIHAGYIPHTHFVFRVKHPEKPRYYMDPWVIFWQVFEQNKKEKNAIQANISPVSPGNTGEKIHFFSKGSKLGIRGNHLEYFWSFGDGGTSTRKDPIHVFQEAGIYPVTLIVKDGSQKASFTQHITINGNTDTSPSFDLICDDHSFKNHKVWKTKAYNSTKKIPNTLHFHSEPFSKDTLATKNIRIQLKNDLKWAENPDYSALIESSYKHGQDWLNIEKEMGEEYIDLKVQPDLNKVVRRYGFYEAYIVIHHPLAVNSPQFVRVRLDISREPQKASLVLDNSSDDVSRSKYFWLKPAFHYEWAEGYEGDFFINANNENDEFIRYRPNLKKGKYKVQLISPVYERPEFKEKIQGFYVIVKSANGKNKVWIKPDEKVVNIGSFEFKKGKKGYIEIISDDSKGLIVADAVKFEKL